MRFAPGAGLSELPSALMQFGLTGRPCWLLSVLWLVWARTGVPVVTRTAFPVLQPELSAAAAGPVCTGVVSCSIGLLNGRWGISDHACGAWPGLATHKQLCADCSLVQRHSYVQQARSLAGSHAGAQPIGRGAGLGRRGGARHCHRQRGGVGVAGAGAERGRSRQQGVSWWARPAAGRCCFWGARAGATASAPTTLICRGKLKLRGAQQGRSIAARARVNRNSGACAAPGRAARRRRAQARP
jgi:hypothetical protein